MSLLLQALQKAAKNRESSAPAPAAEAAPSPPPLQPEPIELTPSPSFSLESAPTQEIPSEPELAIEEEDIFEPEELAASPLLEPQAERFEPFASSAPESARAASILRATETPTTGRLDWIRDHPVHTFAALAGVFMVFYGVYVYLQLFHPALLRGDFLSKPFAAQTPPPLAQPIKPPPAPMVAATPPEPAPALQTPPGPTSAAASPVAGATTAAPSAGPMTGTPAASKSAPTGPVTATPTPPLKPAAAPTVAQATPRAPGTSGRQRAQLRASAASSSAGLEDNLARKEPEPNGAPVSLTMTHAYQALQDGKLDQAEALYREVIQSDAQNIDAMLGLAAIAAQRGNSQQAIGFYERALELEPRNPVAQAGLIGIIGQADPQTSETRLKQLIAREPSAFLYFNLGNLYARQDQWASAQGAYFQAYQMQPDNPDYAYNLAIGLEHLNQPKLALSYYRKAVELSFQKGRANFDQKRVIERIGQLSARVD
jgi:Tfp pilus assembly protein PilF